MTPLTIALATAAFVAVGDIRLDGPVGAFARAKGPAAPTASLGALLSGDVVFGNLECPVTRRGKKTPKTWNFRAAAASLAVIKAASFTVVNIANNHVWDYGEGGFLDTLQALDKAKIPRVGGGRDAAEAAASRVFKTRSGLKVGVLGFTSTFPEAAWAKRRKPGVAFATNVSVDRAVRKAKTACDVLVVSFHGGTELAERPNDAQRWFAHAAVDAGADLVIGHHPHVVQALEVYRGKPIVYSVGNFLFVSPHARWAALVRARLSRSRVERVAIHAIDTWAEGPAPAPAEGVEAVRAALNDYEALEQYPELFELAR